MSDEARHMNQAAVIYPHLCVCLYVTAFRRHAHKPHTLEHFGATETAGSPITRIAQQQGHQHAAKDHMRTEQMTK